MWLYQNVVKLAAAEPSYLVAFGNVVSAAARTTLSGAIHI